MDIMGILWQLGVLAAVLVFGIKIGLASGFANLSKKLFALICAGYGIGVFLFSYIASFYSQQITEAIYGYNTIFYLLMASIMIISGLLTIREWKVHNKNTSTATCMAVVAPCPCCFGSIVVSILIVAPTLGIGISYLSIFVVIALIAVMLITYFTSKILIKFINKPYPIVLGNFMLLLGAYFLLSALIIPNIASVMAKSNNSLNTLTINSSQSIIGVIIVLLVLIIIGIILNKKSNNLLK